MTFGVFMLVVITCRNEVVAKVMFLHMCVILFTGEVSPGPPARQGEPPWARQGELPPLGPGRENFPPGPGCRLQYTVYERPVRILLECILVRYK